MVTLIISAVAFLVVSLLVVSIMNASGTRRTLLTQRIDGYVEGAEARRPSSFDVLLSQRRSMTGTIDRMVEGTSWAEQVSLDMIRADLPLKAGEYVALNLGVGIGLFALGSIALGNVLFGIVAIPVGYLAIRFYVRQRQESRRKKLETHLPEAIDLINTSLRSGFGLLQGMENVAREIPPPLSAEFSQIIKDLSLGRQLDDALVDLCRRVPSHDAYLLVTAILIHKSVGGNLAEVLTGIAGTIRARIRTRDEVHALTTTQRVSSYIVSALPFVVFGALLLVNPDYVSVLWTTEVGRMMLFGAGGLMAIGLVVSRRFVNVDF